MRMYLPIWRMECFWYDKDKHTYVPAYMENVMLLVRKRQLRAAPIQLQSFKDGRK